LLYNETIMKTFTIERPWGHFDQFTKNEPTTIKVHFFKPNSSWSLQYHNHRDEFWRILAGHAVVTIGDEKINAKPGDEFMVPRLTKHRVETLGEPGQLLEICYGDFDEEDQVRLEDKYGRA